MKMEFQHPARFAIGEKRLRSDLQNVRSALSMSTEYPRCQHRNSAYKRDAAKCAQWRSYNLAKSHIENTR